MHEYMHMKMNKRKINIRIINTCVKIQRIKYTYMLELLFLQLDPITQYFALSQYFVG